MKFKTPVIEAQVLKRYKRFFADVQLVVDKKTTDLTVHVPNTGSLKTVIEKDSEKPQKCWITLHGDKTKKLPGTLEAVKSITGAWVGVNTSTPNKLVKDAAEESIRSGKPFLPHWASFKYYKSEYKINDQSRLDGAFLKSPEEIEDQKAKKHFIEIKNTTYLKTIDGKKHAQFPDAVTERGTKHLQEMIHLIKQGHTCELIFVIQRSDADCFSVAEDLDPEYAKMFKKALASGLKVTPLVCQLSPEGVELTNRELQVVSL